MSTATVELSGSFRDQGRQHGEALAPTIREIVAEVVKRDGWDSGKVDRVLAALQRSLRDLAPGVLEEMAGIAEGSGVPYPDILAYNAVADIWMVHSFCTATGWADGPEGAIIGKTNDIGQGKEKYHQPFRRRSGDGLPAVWATWPGSVWANFFVNGEGLCFGGASLGMEARNENGIPSNCMLRVIMDRCATAQQVTETCRAVPVMHHPAHLVLGDDLDGLTVAELTPIGVYVCQGPGAPAVWATNHFCAGPYEGMDSNEARLIKNSRRRLANLQELAERLPHTVEGMVQLLRDHAESGQICQHGDDGMWSSTAYVGVPSQRRMLIARGQPCEAEFCEVCL